MEKRMDAAWTFCFEMYLGHAEWTCSMDIQHRHAVWTCSMDIGMDMDM
jgi:hypothetical protein